MDNQQQVRFREATANGTSYVALQAAASVASNKTITLPDATGTVVLSGAIVNADINASAAIADTKLATIATAGKISDSALPATISSSITGSSASCTGNAATATTLQTARTIGGVSFNGSANINLPGVNTAGNQGTSGNAATATNLSSNRTFALTGDVTGSVSSNLSSGMSIATTVAAAGLLVDAGAIGAYQLCRNSSGASISAGATTAGSNLKQSVGIEGGNWNTAEPSPAGTWRNMSSAALNNNRHHIFQRIA
jgi:hypothetical protein